MRPLTLGDRGVVVTTLTLVLLLGASGAAATGAVGAAGLGHTAGAGQPAAAPAVGGRQVAATDATSSVPQQLEPTARFSVADATKGAYYTLETGHHGGGPYVHGDHVFAVFNGNGDPAEGSTALHTAVYALDPKTLEKDWRYELPADYTLHGRLVFADGTVFLVARQNRDPDTPYPYTLFALDASTGEEQWRRAIGEVTEPNLKSAESAHRPDPHPLFVEGGRVYTLGVSDGPQRMLAFDAGTGEPVWEYDGVVAGVAHSAGNVFVGAKTEQGRETVALDAATGNPQWFVPPNDPSDDFVVDHADGNVLVTFERTFDVGETATVRGLDPESGVPLWVKDEPGYPRVVGSYGDPGVLVVKHQMTDRLRVAGYDERSGEFSWEGYVSESTYWGPQAGARRVYFGNYFDLTGVDPARGAAGDGRWTASIDESTFGENQLSEVREVDGVVYALDRAHGIHAWNVGDGARRADGSLDADPTWLTAADGTVYVSTKNGVIIALEPVDGTATSGGGLSGGGSQGDGGSGASASADKTATPTTQIDQPGFGVLAALLGVLLALGAAVFGRRRSDD